MRILATSRQPLRIDGETLCPVPPLPVPPATAAPPAPSAPVAVAPFRPGGGRVDTGRSGCFGTGL